MAGVGIEIINLAPFIGLLKEELLKYMVLLGINGMRQLPGPNLNLSNNFLSGTPICRNTAFESLSIQTLEGYVLPLLSSIPLCIHKMHLALRNGKVFGKRKYSLLESVCDTITEESAYWMGMYQYAIRVSSKQMSDKLIDHGIKY